MKMVHRQTYGPFQLGVALILQDCGNGKFTGEFRRAGELKKEHMVDDRLMIFKFAAGRPITLEVCVGFGDRLEFSVTQGTTINPFRKDAKLTGDRKMNLKVAIICGDANCNPTSMICPPGKPYARCVNGQLTCVGVGAPNSDS